MNKRKKRKMAAEIQILVSSLFQWIFAFVASTCQRLFNRIIAVKVEAQNAKAHAKLISRLSCVVVRQKKKKHTDNVELRFWRSIATTLPHSIFTDCQRIAWNEAFAKQRYFVCRCHWRWFNYTVSNSILHKHNKRHFPISRISLSHRSSDSSAVDVVCLRFVFEVFSLARAHDSKTYIETTVKWPSSTTLSSKIWFAISFFFFLFSLPGVFFAFFLMGNLYASLTHQHEMAI